MTDRARNRLVLVVAALMVAAAALQSPVFRLVPARVLGSVAAAGYGESDSRAVLPNKPGQTSDARDRWEPTPGAAWLGGPDCVVLTGEAAIGLVAGSSDAVLVPCRSRICCWLL